MKIIQDPFLGAEHKVLACLSTVAQLDPNHIQQRWQPVGEQYDALIQLMARLGFEQDHDLLAGALAVYGWMPKMMRGIPHSREYLKELIRRLKSSNPEEAPDVLSDFARDDHRTSALTAVNNSVVGTSKLLHFIVPDRVPIWDSVVASFFGLSANKEYFADYARLIHRVAKSDPHTLGGIRVLAAVSDFPQVSNLRAIEFALFINVQGVKGGSPGFLNPNYFDPMPLSLKDVELLRSVGGPHEA